MSGSKNISQHLADIDFRTKEVRQKNMKQDFMNWYDDLYERQLLDYSDILQAQLTVLSSVLWYVLPDKEYKKFMKREADARI